MFKLPAHVFYQRIIVSYNDRSAYNRESTTFEYTVVQLLAWTAAQYQASVPGSRSSAAASVFFSKNTALWFLYLRKVLHGPEGLGDIAHKEVLLGSFTGANRGTAAVVTGSSPLEFKKTANGIWLYSPSRGQVHDVIIYYVHGGDFVGASVYLYLEYLCNILTSLQAKNFKNPAILAVEYSTNSSYFDQLDEVCIGWNHLCVAHNYSTLAVVADSNGASLCMSMLLHCARPRKGITVVNQKPAAAVLLSPWAQLYAARESNKSDYVSPKLLVTYAQHLRLPDSGGSAKPSDIYKSYKDPYASPANCRSQRWWSQALPSRGTYITFGSEEILAPEIRLFYQKLRVCGDVLVEERRGQIHAWPITLFQFGRSQYARDVAVDAVARKLELMLQFASASNTNIVFS